MNVLISPNYSFFSCYSSFSIKKKAFIN